MDQLKSKLGDLHLILGFLLVAVVFVVIWRARGRRKVLPPPPPEP